VAVLTNGSLLYLPEVQVDLIMADALLTKLDAGTEDLYYRINRPLPELTFDRLVRGLGAFRRVYGGALWVEVMLIAGINDSDEALRDLAAVLARIRPDEIHVTKPSRPPAEAWVALPGDDVLARAAAILGPRARVITGPADPLDLSDHRDLDEAVLAILERHPTSLADLTEALNRWAPGHADAALARLGETGRVREVVRGGRTFWAPADGRYGWGPLGPGGDESKGPGQGLARQQP
jgi:wyosine [tRNA(Phe)-imidazoG37] synthetase (radical SAM superfamily)